MMQATASTATYSCACVGPQNGQPLCPCQMRGVTIQNGRYVRITDLGPVPSKEQTDLLKQAMEPFGQIWSQGPSEDCLHDQMDRAEPNSIGKPRMLACTCPKCSPRC